MKKTFELELKYWKNKVEYLQEKQKKRIDQEQQQEQQKLFIFERETRKRMREEEDMKQKIRKEKQQWTAGHYQDITQQDMNVAIRHQYMHIHVATG